MIPNLPTLAEHLARRSRLPDGVLRVAYPTDRFDLRTPAVEHVSSGGFSSSPLPFETLHQRVPVANQLWDGGQNAVDTDELVFRSPGFCAAYHRLVAYLAREILGGDIATISTVSLAIFLIILFVAVFISNVVGGMGGK